LNELQKDMRYVSQLFEADMAKASAQQYVWHVERFLAHFGGEPPENPNRALQEFCLAVTVESERPWSRSMVNTSFYAVKKYYEKVLGIPVEKRFFTNLGRETGHLPRILSREEEARVLEAAGSLGEAERNMVQVGWYCALRTGELVRLEKKWLDGNLLRVRIEKAKNAWKAISLPDGLAEGLTGMGRTGRKYFFNMYDEKYDRWRAYQPREWSWFFRDWNRKVLGGEGVRWHDFARHTRLTHYAEDTKSFLAVLQLSGHQNPAVCRRYFQWARVEVPELEALAPQRWDWA